MKYEVGLYMTVEVEVNDQSVIDRCVDNHDDSGVSQPDERGSGGWRNTFYKLDTEEKVLEMLAYNFGVRDSRLSQLDGWADLPDSAATGSVIHIDYESVRRIDG